MPNDITDGQKIEDIKKDFQIAATTCFLGGGIAMKGIDFFMQANRPGVVLLGAGLMALGAIAYLHAQMQQAKAANALLKLG
ncbi:MAG: hypothetical protein FWE93_04680 [Alphaproteobacteria bacterium]|nr:hypothetical protein [Alphaproteobacteria bacterium]